MPDLNSEFNVNIPKSKLQQAETSALSSESAQAEESNYFINKETEENPVSSENSMEKANDYINLVSNEPQHTKKIGAIAVNVNDPNLEFEYDDETGNIISMKNKTKNHTTNYSYDASGNLTSSKTYISDTDELMNERTYNEKGQVKTQKEYISEETGLKGEYFHSYTYDDKGRIATSTVREGLDAYGTVVGEYEYEYEGDSVKPKTRTDSLHGEVLEYQYAADGKTVIEAHCKNTDGDLINIRKYNEDGTLASIESDDEITTFEYSDGLVTKSERYDVENGKPKGKSLQTTYYENGKLSAKVNGKYTYVYEYGDDGSIKTFKYNSDDCEKGVPKPGSKPISNDEINKAELNGVMNDKLGQELANLAQANNMGTKMHCLSGVIKTLNAKWPEDSWEANGVRPSVAADAFANMDNPDDPIRKHFAEVEDVSVDELKSLPPGCMVIWDNNFPGSAGMGHITFTLGDGQELSDHQCEMYIDYNTAYKVYCPVD